MTPEEKAVEITKKFGYAAGTYINDLVLWVAKRCAIICCDEILETLAENGVIYPHREYENKKDYWTQVKKEIEKL